MLAVGAYLGGVRITRMAWVGRSLRADFTTIHAERLHQFYAGRELVGTTLAPGERSILLRVRPGTWQPRITPLAVDVSVSDQDFGDLLPARAFNRPRLSFTASGGSWANAKTIEVLTSEVPGDPIGDGVERARAVFQHQGEYSLKLKALPGSGYWPVRVQGRDGSPGGGNVGTAAETVVRVNAHPPDLVAVSSTRRFTVSVAGGVATVGCEIST